MKRINRRRYIKTCRRWHFSDVDPGASQIFVIFCSYCDFIFIYSNHATRAAIAHYGEYRHPTLLPSHVCMNARRLAMTPQGLGIAKNCTDWIVNLRYSFVALSLTIATVMGCCLSAFYRSRSLKRSKLTWLRDLTSM